MRKLLVAISAGVVFLFGCSHSTVSQPPAANRQSQVQLFISTRSSSQYSVLYYFGGTSGAVPWASLTQDSAGNFYGTTAFGGSSGAGVVFKLDSNGNETVLHSFSNANNGPGGYYPLAGVVRDSAGNLYGTTYVGGSSGVGVVFKVDPSGNETVLHNFNNVPADGAYPQGNLLQDAAGNLYGTSDNGGSVGAGTVFKLDPSGSFTLLHSFIGSDGQQPSAGLIQDAAGILYGTTVLGGGGNGNGVVFKVDLNGNYTKIHSFNGADGSEPWSSLLQDAAGNLYGTTSLGGNSNKGVVFKLAPSGNETVLYSFKGKDGDGPRAGVVQDAAGSLYGTTFHGGAFGQGTIFEITQSGTKLVRNEKVLKSLHSKYGRQPYASLFMDAAGALYGTTSKGGFGPLGVIFKLIP